MKNYFPCFLYLLLIWGCLDTFEPEEVFAICETTSEDYFNPTNKSFIPPSKSTFLEELCVPLELGEDVSFYDLTADKVCLLEQHLGQITDSLNTELCESGFTKDSLDNYYYQYFGLRMDEQEYILVNAFHKTEVDSFDWKREAFIEKCKNGLNQWRVLFNVEELSFSQYRPHSIKEIFYLPSFPYEKIEGCSRCVAIKDLETFQLGNQDICLLKRHFEKLKAEKSVGCFYKNYLINFNREWLLQYIGVKKGNRRWIYINAAEEPFYREYNFYSTFPSTSCDGGESFWGVFFDLDSLEFEGLQFNAF